MPQFNLPVSLQTLALDSLVTQVVHSCDKLSVQGSLIDLDHCVADIKQYIRNYVPDILFAEFCRRFLDQFYRIGMQGSIVRPVSHYKPVLKIMMDIEIGRCDGAIVRYLDPSDAHRIQGLKILDWSGLLHCNPMPRGFENYRLQDLTTFIFPWHCTDNDLEIIGPRCLKLQVLMIQHSSNVTDRGLRALRSCSYLRILNIYDCPVSDKGINELLSEHDKIEEFNIFDDYTTAQRGFDILSRSNSLMCPSMKRFLMKSNPVTDAHLHSVVALFPNLTYLGFSYRFNGHLCMLKSLKNLTVLHFRDFSSGFSVEELKELLMSIGSNISRLTVPSNVRMMQEDLNFLFAVCGNIEWLHFAYEAGRPNDRLVIPPFQKLKHLGCFGNVRSDNYRPVLEFGEMLKLEVLSVENFSDIFQMIESMLLDNIKFPNLREVRTVFDSDEIVSRIMQIVRENNLDFSIRWAKMR